MNNSKVSIRFANPGDLTEMLKMFVDTISTICMDDYSPQQINVWISSVENTQRWTDKLTTHGVSTNILVKDIIPNKKNSTEWGDPVTTDDY